MEISDIFKLNQRQPECGQGKMLIAQPFLHDLYFNHSCICLVDYEEKASATGLVLNKKTNLFLGDLIKGLDSELKIPVFCGGPMSMDKLFYIHDYPDIKYSKKVVDGLYFNGDFETVLRYLNIGFPAEGHIKFFVGYSGWEPFQLTDEIANHVWAVSESEISNYLKTETEDYWYECVKQLGATYKPWLLCPPNPYLN